MRVIQLTAPTIPLHLAIASEDVLLLRQDACYLLRDPKFCQQYRGQFQALAHDVAQRQIDTDGVPLLTDEQWVALCANARGVMLWR